MCMCIQYPHTVYSSMHHVEFHAEKLLKALLLEQLDVTVLAEQWHMVSDGVPLIHDHEHLSNSYTHQLMFS